MSGPSGPSFRRAARRDVPVIVRLLADDQLGRTREQAGAGPDELPADYWRAFEAIAADPRNLLVVAELDRSGSRRPPRGSSYVSTTAERGQRRTWVSSRWEHAELEEHPLELHPVERTYDAFKAAARATLSRA